MPIPSADHAVPPPTGNGTPANHGSQRQNRKRSGAGYQVEQTTSAVNILTKQQQPPEQSLTPPIKLRRVHDGRRVVFKEQSTQEPMETEPVITACTASLPVAVFGPPPEKTPPTSGNILSTTSETTPAPVLENIEPIEDDDPAEIPSEVLSKFLPEHQEALREHLINENLEARHDLKIIVQNAEKLLKLLGERKIELSKNRSKPPFPTLFAKLKAFSITKTPELFSTYFTKASVFFSAVNTNQIINTGCLTSMLNLKYQIKGFTEQSEEVIRFIASQPFLKQIASMRNGKGFPSRKEVEIFLSIPCLKQGWQPGRDEAVQGKPIDRELLIHISSMHNGKGFPRKEQVAAFMTMPCLKEGWQPGGDEAVQDKPVDRVLLMHIASMNSTRGLPTREQVAAFMTMPCLKEDWQPGCDEAVQDKPIDRVLLMHIASMNHCKGFPTREQVAAFMSMPCLKEDWQPGRDEAVQDKPIDRELIKRIASINSCKGFPTKLQVAAFMTIPCLRKGWQPGRDEDVLGKPIDRALLMHIASMNSGKGFPERGQVKAFMTMPCLKQDWQPGNDVAVQDNLIDRDLLVRIASMYSCKGFPERGQVKVFMTMPCLKQDWQPGNDVAVQDNLIDRDLLVRIASMYSCKGFPTKLQVAAFMTIPCLRQGWQQGSDEDVQGKPIDWALLMHIASMNSGKGFPERGQVKAFITMPCLKQDWQPGNDEASQDKPIDRELLKRIASMNSCKGFPTKAQVEAFMTIPCLRQGWQPDRDEAVQDKAIDRALLMHNASMNHGRGFPTKTQVEAFMTIPCLRQGWQPGRDEDVQGKPIERALLMHIASMNHGKGFPANAQVAAFMSMPCLRQDWQGCDEAVQDNPIDRELLAYIASMNSCKGFPAEAHTSAFILWLPRVNKKHCLKIASRVFASSGLPEPRLLTANERALRRYLPDLPEYSIDSDDDFSDSDNEPDHERAEDQQMKVLALFCSAPNKWRMNVAEFEQYLTSFTNARQNDRSQVLSALASLLPMLFNHGGAGVRFWLSRHNEDQQDRRLLTKALSIPAPLDTVRFALTQLPESECLTYIVLCRNLSPAPDKVQWYALKPLREQLDQQFTMARSKAMMLEILWSQPEAKRPGYGEKLDSFFDIVFEIVPTIRQLYRIHQAFGPKKMQGFLDACIARRANTAETLMVKAQELLMEGLLLAHHYLNDYEHIPDLCFSSQVASRNGKGVVINGDAAMPGNKRLWNFITAMLIELEQTPEYKFEKQQLTVLCGRLSDSGSIVLPKPEFSLAGSGFVINNWSLEQVQTFFTATEFTERWYKKPRDPREPCAVRLDERLARMRARASETEKNGNPKATNQKAANQKRVPPSVILSVIKSGLPLNLVVWTSLDYYAKNGQLTDKLCQALAPVIEQQAAIAPDSVKNAVSARLTEIDARNMADQATITQPLSLIPPPPVTDNSLHRPQVTLATAMATLDHFQVLGEAELEILQPYRDQMTPIQLASVIDKMCHRIDAVTLLDLLTTYEKKRKDPLGLNELISWTDDDRSDWLADILEYPAMTLMNR
ncbi:hypothetical protein [Endozoicomonas acroporae]|uniref:hypothetical protein n=1 Tax=Endozoicomonas acroporae TaxID=1701104 RepID=UPI003D78BDA4